MSGCSGGAGMASSAASARRMAAALAGVNGILTSNMGGVPSGSVPGAGITSVSGTWVLACAEAAAEQEVLAVGLLQGLGEGGGFLAMAAPAGGAVGRAGAL